jgi:sporulation protein YlmC with PRC-barrel domain
MLMSDLLGSRVRDSDGVCVGRVMDVRMVQDGPYIDGFGHALRLDTLVIGRSWTPARLGYVRGGVRGPALLRWLSSRIEGRAIVVPWIDVTAVDDEVQVRRRTTELRRMRDVVSGW